MTAPGSESPQERVDFYVGRQVEVRRRAGDDADAEEIRRGTAALLERADAERRAHPVPDRDGKTGAEVIAQKREGTGEALAEKAGAEFFYGEERVEPLIVQAKPGAQVPRGVDGEKHVALMRRIGLLMKNVPGHVAKAGESIYAGKVYPRFAQLLHMTTQAAALHSSEPWAGKGKYHGLSLEDRHRRYFAELERICNLSNAVTPVGWWVPR